MKKNNTTTIDCFTELMVYTLEFNENSQRDIYTIEKLIFDYETLIVTARKKFDEQKVDLEFDEILFPILAWIDEVILSSTYEQKRVWRKNLLQKKFFNTSNAGHEFYQRLSSLEKNDFDLRSLYLYCLFLGFKGKYYNSEDKETLDAIFEREKSLTDDSFSKNFPKMAFRDAYAQSPSPQKKKFQASYKGIWVLISVSLLVGLVLFLTLQAHLNGLLDKYNIF